MKKKLKPLLKQFLDFFPQSLHTCILSGSEKIIVAHNKSFETFFTGLKTPFIGKHFAQILNQVGANYRAFVFDDRAESQIFTCYDKLFLSFRKKLDKELFELDPSEDMEFLFWVEMPYQHSEKYDLLWNDFEAILNSIYDGIWIIDKHGITRYVNKALKRIAGIKAKDVVGKHVTVPMTEGKFVSCVTLDALKQKKALTQFDDYVNGKRCLNTSTPIFDKNGEVHRVVASIRDMTELAILQEKVAEAELKALHYKDELEKAEHGGFFIGNSPTFQKSLVQLKKVAKSDSSVLLMGETGTGKSLASSYIHENSPRKDKVFIAINCAAIAESLIESELFGYNKGAFTGADQQGKKGYFELADGGTLLLDEIGELPLGVQAKLLHVLDNYAFHKVGGNTAINVNVRIIAATNRALDELVETGEFRKDLYYRLRVLTVEIPPLRERFEDIPLLANSFLNAACKRLGSVKVFHKKTLLALTGYSWPGNVRELRGAVEYLVAMSEGNTIQVEEMRPYLFANEKTKQSESGISFTSQNLTEAVNELERTMIKEALAQEGSTYKAATRLGVSQSSVVRKAKNLGIKLSG